MAFRGGMRVKKKSQAKAIGEEFCVHKKLGSLSTEHIGTDFCELAAMPVPSVLLGCPRLELVVLLLWPQGYGDSLAGMFLLNPRPRPGAFQLESFPHHV